MTATCADQGSRHVRSLRWTDPLPVSKFGPKYVGFNSLALGTSGSLAGMDTAPQLFVDSDFTIRWTSHQSSSFAKSVRI